MAKPTLHVPLKDSPTTFLTVGINDTDTVLQVANSADFEAANITRLTLGIDEEETETVEVVSYGVDPSGNPNGEITVVRGAGALSWPSNTTISRVFTAEDLNEVHEYLDYLDERSVTNGDLHNHAGGDGSQIPTEGLEDDAVTSDKILDGAVITDKILNSNVTPAKIENRTRKVLIPIVLNTLDGVFGINRYGVPMESGEITTFYAFGVIPQDYVSGGQIEGIFVGGLLSDSGNVYTAVEVSLAQEDEDCDEHYYQENYTELSMTSTVDNEVRFTDPVLLPDAAPGDLIEVTLARLGNNPLDTASCWVHCRGALLTYTADS